MKDLIDEKINRYIDHLIGDPLEPALCRMEAEGEREQLPLIDRQVGRLLELLCLTVGARRVLEIGTAIGYSTSYLARGVGESGRVMTLEFDPERAERARENLAEAGLLPRVEIIEGDSRETLPQITGPFDLIFNDGDKVQYPDVARRAAQLLRPGGLLVTDNALWGGWVATEAGDADQDTLAIRAHNQLLFGSDAFTSTLVPVRDGLVIARRSTTNADTERTP